MNCKLFCWHFLIAIALLAPFKTSAADRYWVAVSGNWNDSANWSATSGGAGGATVPGSSDIAIFDSSSGDCAINANVSVKGVLLVYGYSNTVAQGDYTITIGDNGYRQEGGAFAGGTTNISITTSSVVPLVITNGSFTSTSGTLQLRRDNGEILSLLGGAFTHNKGTVKLVCYANVMNAAVYALTVKVPFNLYRLVYAAGNAKGGTDYYRGFKPVISEAGCIVVEEEFLIQPSGSFLFAGDPIELRGNVSVASGSLGGSSLLVFNGTNDQYYIPAGGRLPCAVIDKAAGRALNGGTNDLAVTALTLLQGEFVAPAGILDVADPMMSQPRTNIAMRGGVFTHNNGTVRLAQTDASQRTYVTTSYLRDSLVLHNLRIHGGNTKGPVQFLFSFVQGATLTVMGDFEMAPHIAGSATELNGGEIICKGNIAVGSGAGGGTATLRVSGGGTHAYSSSGGRLPSLVVDKPGGALVPADAPSLALAMFTLIDGDFTAPTGTLDIATVWGAYDLFTYQNGNYQHNNGTLRFSMYSTTQSTRAQNINIKQPLELNNLAFVSGHSQQSRLSYVFGLFNNATLVLRGNLTALPGTNLYFRLDGAPCQVEGDVACGRGMEGGTLALEFSGANQQLVSHGGGTMPAGNWTISKPSGTLGLATPVILSGAAQDVVWQSGNIDLGTNTLSIGRHLNINKGAGAATVLIAPGGVAGRLAITGKASGVTNAALRVDALRAARDDTKERSYTVLSNNTILGGELAAVAWTPPWRGKVNYTENGGRNITVYDFRFCFPGMVLVLH